MQTAGARDEVLKLLKLLKYLSYLPYLQDSALFQDTCETGFAVADRHVFGRGTERSGGLVSSRVLSLGIGGRTERRIVNYHERFVSDADSYDYSIIIRAVDPEMKKLCCKGVV